MESKRKLLSPHRKLTEPERILKTAPQILGQDILQNVEEIKTSSLMQHEAKLGPRLISCSVEHRLLEGL